MKRQEKVVSLDGTEATAREHAARLGVHRSRVYQRLRGREKFNVSIYSSNPALVNEEIERLKRGPT